MAYADKDINLIWKYTHKDYRGKVGGVKTIMINRRGRTVLVPIEGLTEKEFADELAYAKDCVARGRRC